MDKKDWESLYLDPDLSRFVASSAKQKTGKRDVWGDLEQYAWLRIGCEQAGKPMAHYRRVAITAINTEYNRAWRHWKARREIYSRISIDSIGRERMYAHEDGGGQDDS